VGNDTVLFPQAKGSLRSVQQGFVKKEQVTDLIVYETIRNDNTHLSNHFRILVLPALRMPKRSWKNSASG
jgi:hypothetical protein